MHPLEASKSVAAEVDAKIDTKNDQKMVPRWGQNLVKNRFQDGFRNEVHLGPVLGPSWANSMKHGVFSLVYVVKWSKHTMFPPFLLFDFHKILNESVKN